LNPGPPPCQGDTLPPELPARISTLILCYLKLVLFIFIFIRLGDKFLGDFKIRNVVEEDFNEISVVAENCSPMTNERKSIYHIFTKFFKKTSLVIEEGMDV